ncbi:hypothetical protein D0869_08891 [Hortaea werneckii]|uniref:Extracellular membrane protein CFEM domain-containing protein n=1 Tax=Hortaea werneckii TaxID=91943 RepID=A0A3M6WK98_HORWE|nr:hypothetical protein D0869_08891 [Hortaea werneckii]RMX98657.1 hypothetical protein D0867_12362 [Hortaea werneckii]RMY28890.1 hypothetical protein D0866_09087 [Hortaea werneckii]
MLPALLWLVTVLTSVEAQSAKPACLDACLPPTSQLQAVCSSNTLPSVLDCVNSTCTHTYLASHMTLAYTPKILYSCQQSLVPGATEPGDTLTLHGDGRCKTSPYAFRSFVTDGGSQAMARACHVEIYANEGCEGESTQLSLNDLEEGGCQFTGGKSAKMICRLAESENQAALTHLRAMCPRMMANYADFDDTSTSTVTSLPALASINETTKPSMASSTMMGGNDTGVLATAEPYTGMATKTAQASIAALTLLCVVFATL